MDLHISIMDLHNSIMDLHNSIMDLHNSINDVQFAVQDWRRAVRKRGGSFLRESQSEVGECVIGLCMFVVPWCLDATGTAEN